MTAGVPFDISATCAEKCRKHIGLRWAWQETASVSVDISTTHNAKDRRRVGPGKCNMCRITAGVPTYSYGVA